MNDMSKYYDETMLRLDRAEKKFQMLFELSPIGMAMVNHETGDFMEVNQSLLETTGYTKDEFLNLSYWDITPREFESQENQQIEDLNLTGRFGPNEKEYIKKDGTRYPIRISGFMLIDVDGTKVVWGIIEDISIRKAFEEELKYSANHDVLTKLANRRLFDQSLQVGLAYCKREERNLALIIIDLDKFKNINDEFGHEYGDALLVGVAKRLVKITYRDTDTVARIGGDEFAIILPLISGRDGVKAIGKRICSSLSEPFSILDEKVTITASIGIAIYPDHGSTGEELYRYADKATYAVKNNKGNDVKVFDHK